MFEILLALVYGNLLEWILHRFILHELGRRKGNFWSFHWKRHHRICRNSNFADPDYSGPITWNTTGKEIFGLGLLALVHLPILWVFPAFYCGLLLHAVIYYGLHAASHRYPAWGKRWLRWHYDHHMIGNQGHNWCVTFPLFDYVFRTRVKQKNAK